MTVAQHVNPCEQLHRLLRDEIWISRAGLVGVFMNGAPPPDAKSLC
jgi:hypothetical protein